MLLQGPGGIRGNVSLPVQLQGDGLPWRAGEILRARVLEAAGEDVLLLLAGRKLRVQSQVPLEGGQELQLLVVGRGREGNLILRLVDSLLGERGRPDPVQLGRLLGDMGLEASPGNIRLAAELLRQGFAVTPDTLALLGRALGQGEPAPAEAAALVWLWGQGLPLKETFVKPLVTLFQEAGPDLLQELFPALAALQGEGQEEGQGLLQQLLLSPAREGGRTLQDLPRLLGLDYENLVLRSLFSREGPGELPAGDAAAPVGKLPAQKSLKSFLLALGQGEEGKLPAELEGLLAKITGLQLLTAGPWSLHCLGWLDLPRQAAPFFLSIQEEEQGRGGEQGRPLELVLFLSLPALGPVLVEMRCSSVLVLSLAVEREGARRLLDGYRQGLLAALEGLPWPVQVLPCRLQKTGTVRASWQRRLTTLSPVRRQVDVRV
ncbi:MAG: hypothetical protein WBL73_03780 [bacterium]